MMAGSLFPFGLFLLLATSIAALRITPDSSCSSVCGDSSTTNASDIVCNDFDYYATSAGSTFMNCIECLQTSNATRDSDNDVSWFLYNLRYASAVCLFDFPAHNASSNATSLCDVDHACKPLQGAIESGNLEPSNETEYGYCQADDDAFYGTSINDCVSCLQSSASTYTANFLLALEAGCKQEPPPGTLLSITGSLFSTTAINITAPSNATTSTSTSSSSSSSPSLTTTIAIAASLGTLFLTASALFTLYCLRQRRYAREDAHLLNSPYSSHQPPQHGGYLYYGKEPSSSIGGGGGGGAPLQAPSFTSAPPRYTVDYKPNTTTTNNNNNNNNNDDANFDSNAEYYDRLEGRSRGRPLQAHPVRLTAGLAATDAAGPPEDEAAAAALPTHPAYIPRTMMPGALGGRPSRTASISGSGGSRSASGSMSVSSETAPARRSGQQQHQQGRKKPSYAMEVFLEGRGSVDPIERAPSRNINIQLGGGGGGNNSSQVGPQGASEEQQRQQRLSPPPRALLEPRRRKSLSPPPPPDRSMTSTPATISSLILPPVPKIRLPSKKPPRLQVDVDEPAPGEKKKQNPLGISGPLAFPDSRFSVRAAAGGSDRIVEQTVDRNGRAVGPHVEVPIGSGKSYLYG